MRIFVLALMLIATSALAGPTPTAKQLFWDDYTDPDGIGFNLYWAMQKEPSPRAYDDTRRIDIGRPDPEQVIILSIKPNAKSSMCFQLTAYDAAGNESDFSNEVCGFMGIEKPKNLRK